MRPRHVHRALLVAIALLYAQHGTIATAAQCDNRLGVSRTISIDTAGGSLHGGLQYKVPSLLRDGEVVLTFDDGPLRANTRKVLAALKRHCTKATFFMVGRMAVADPAMVREVASYGHTVATHTWSHKDLKRRSRGRAAGEIELGISAVQHALGRPVAPFFRFPYLSDPKTMIDYGRSRDLAIFSIDIDSYDYRTRSGDRVRRTIMRQLASRKKGILLFHDIQISTARAMRPLLDELHHKGFKVVHLRATAPLASVAVYDAQAARLHAKRRYSASIRPVGSGGELDSSDRRTARLNGRSSNRPKTVRRKQAPKPDTSWMKQVLGN